MIHPKNQSRGIFKVVWGSHIELVREQKTPYPLTVRELDGIQWQPRDKVQFYDESPYDTTLLMDSDVQILDDDLDFGFEMAEKHGIALCFAPAYNVKDHWRLPVKKDLPDYNAGVIFWNRHKLPNIFIEIAELCKHGHQNRVNDQSMLSKYLYDKGINPYVLPPTWNLRPQYGMLNGYGKIKLLHSLDSWSIADAGNGFWQVGGKK
jgi:hypothetical protein